MTKVFCWMRLCINNSDGVCQCQNISFDDMDYEYACEQYEDITETSEYMSEFYKFVLRPDDGGYYKEKAYGKRIEFEDLVFYTQYDYRNPEAVLTEAISGFRACTIADLNNADKMLKVRRLLKENSFTYKPVAEYEEWADPLEELLPDDKQ